jgi:prophage regulatory protein
MMLHNTQLEHYPMSRVLRLPEVIEKTGLSKSTIYLRLKDKKSTFPRPIHLGSSKTVGFIEEELDEWIQSQAALRQGGEQS